MRARGARRLKGASAGPDRHLAALEGSEELAPLLVGRRAVLLRRPERPAASEKGEVRLDRLVGIDSLVTHRHVEILVTRDDLGDVGRKATSDHVRDENSSEVVGSIAKRHSVVAVDEAGAGECLVEGSRYSTRL
jgi:hypothetical protein